MIEFKVGYIYKESIKDMRKMSGNCEYNMIY